MKKLNIGSVVKIREDLEVGELYFYNDDSDDFEVVTEDMIWQRGKEVMILGINVNENGNVGYIVDFTECIFTKSMLE